MSRCLLWLPAVIVAAAMIPWNTASGIAADEERPFRPGVESRTWNGRPYDLVLPKDFDPARSYGLVVLLDSGGGYGYDESSRKAWLRIWKRIAEDGWITCVPKSVHHRTDGDNWSTGETEDLADLARHLAPLLGVPLRRIHLFASGDVSGFAALAAFEESAPWSSVCFDRCKFRGGSVPKRMRSVGTLVTWDIAAGPPDGHDRLLESLRSKARSTDTFATEHVTSDARFRWWLDAMDGRFVPGRDHSLPWTAAPSSIETLHAALADAQRGGVVWFHAPQDADAEGARELQLDVLFDARLRESGARVLAFRAAIESARELAAALDVESTPAIVVLDARGRVKARFDGTVQAQDLGKALKAVRGN